MNYNFAFAAVEFLVGGAGATTATEFDARLHRLRDCLLYTSRCV